MSTLFHDISDEASEVSEGAGAEEIEAAGGAQDGAQDGGWCQELLAATGTSSATNIDQRPDHYSDLHQSSHMNSNDGASGGPTGDFTGKTSKIQVADDGASKDCDDSVTEKFYADDSFEDLDD